MTGIGCISSFTCPLKNSAPSPMKACSTSLTVSPIEQLASRCGWPTNIDSSGDGVVSTDNTLPDQLPVKTLASSDRVVSMRFTATDLTARLLKGTLHAVTQLANGWSILPGRISNLPSRFMLDFRAISIFRRVKSPSILILEKRAPSWPWKITRASAVANGFPSCIDAIPLFMTSQIDCSKPDSISQLRSACALNCSQSSFAASALATQLFLSASYFAFWRLRAASQMGSTAWLTQRLFKGLRNRQVEQSRISLCRLHCMSDTTHAGAGVQLSCSQAMSAVSNGRISAVYPSCGRAAWSKLASTRKSTSDACNTSRRNARLTSIRAMSGLSLAMEKPAELI